MKAKKKKEKKLFNPINHGVYENLFTMGGGHMVPQPENPRNMSVWAGTW